MFGIRCLRNFTHCSGVASLLKSFDSCRNAIRTGAVREGNAACRLYENNNNKRLFSSDISEAGRESVDFEELAKGDEAVLKRLKVLALEVDLWRQDGSRVPSRMDAGKWKDLLILPSRSQRCKQLAFWWTVEKKREADKRKKEERRREGEARKAEYLAEMENNKHIHYGFMGNNIFLRIYDSKIDSLHNNKLIQAMQFGQSVVIDCSYDSQMTVREASNCAKQLTIMFAENRLHDDPFDLHFCNAHPEYNVIQKLKKTIPTMYENWFPMNVTEKSYLDIFPKERLVYLTPHCREELKTFSHDDIYIIGAMVDKVNHEPLSLAKAKSEGLRMAKLPLDRHLQWGLGSKRLTLNQVLKILLDIKTTGDWEKAFEHVPKRKLFQKEPSIELAERSLKKSIARKKGRYISISSLYD